MGRAGGLCQWGGQGACVNGEGRGLVSMRRAGGLCQNG
jgi:hypothetical protein